MKLCVAFSPVDIVLTDSKNQHDQSAGSSLSAWTLKDLSAPDEVWVVFKSHHDVSASVCWPSSRFLPRAAVIADGVIIWHV